MIAPSLCHIEYLLPCGDEISYKAQNTHAIYIPLHTLGRDGCNLVESDQLHFKLKVELNSSPDVVRPRSGATAGAETEQIVLDSANVLQVTLTPKTPLTLTSCRLLFSGDFSSFKRGLFNGYQSWTNTSEISLWASQRGLMGTPKSVIDKWVLDSSGDYRFVKYANTPGKLHGWSFAYFTRPDTVTFIGGLNERSGFTMIAYEAGEGLNVLPEPPTVELASDEEATIAQIGLVTVHDKAAAESVQGTADEADDESAPKNGPFAKASSRHFPSSAPDPKNPKGVASTQVVDRAFEAWFEQLRSANPDLALPRRHEMLTGYTSWYRHYEDINEEKLEHDLKSVTRAFGQLDTAGFRRLFQVDDGYSKKGDWLEIFPDRFPNGLRPLVEKIETAGFTPGLWMAPFVCERESDIYQTHQDWLLLDASGKHVRTGSHWSGHVALDTQNPEVRAYVTKCLQTATREWGFKMLKLDFLYAACMVPHAGLNRGQLMADAMQLCRDAVGEDVIIDGCGVPLTSAFGLVDFCRVGCDVGLDWNGPAYLHATDRERVSTLHSLGNTIYRAGLDDRAFGNDPDVILLRPDVDYTDEQRAMVVNGAALHASMLLTSDDTDAWTLKQIDTFQEALNLMRIRKEAGR